MLSKDPEAQEKAARRERERALQVGEDGREGWLVGGWLEGGAVRGRSRMRGGLRGVWDAMADRGVLMGEASHGPCQERAAASHVRIVDETGTAHAAGRRKTSVARVWLREGSGLIMVNAVPYDMHWRSLARRNDVITPLALTQRLGMYDVMICVRGGGDTGQAQAARHGIARALQRQDPTLRPMLKAAGLLARDARIVERKKPGRKKARKSFQWVKR